VSEREHIGTLHPMPFGHRAKCSAAGCGWSLDVTKGREEAERSLRSHAALLHPQPIHIYREGDA
jgi:hypothetical protein